MPHSLWHQAFHDEVLCDVASLEVCDFLLEQPYILKHHAIYESRLHSVIIYLRGYIYRVLDVVPTTKIYLISTKQCRKVISQTRKF